MRSKLAVGGEVVHVGGDHPQMAEAPPPRLGLDEGALRGGVGDRGDPGGGILLGHPQAERAPAAAELQDLLAVGETGVGDRRSRASLGLGQCLARRRGRRVFRRGPRQREEVRRHLVVLSVGGVACGAIGKRSLSRSKSISLGPDRVEGTACPIDQRRYSELRKRVGERGVLHQSRRCER